MQEFITLPLLAVVVVVVAFWFAITLYRDFGLGRKIRLLQEKLIESRTQFIQYVYRHQVGSRSGSLEEMTAPLKPRFDELRERQDVAGPDELLDLIDAEREFLAAYFIRRINTRQDLDYCEFLVALLETLEGVPKRRRLFSWTQAAFGDGHQSDRVNAIDKTVEALSNTTEPDLVV